MKRLKFYLVDEKYIDYLKAFDKHVPNVVYKNSHDKFFCGIVLINNNQNYFVPISHKKNVNERLNIKIKNVSKKTIASLRFQYMIPVPRWAIKLLPIKELKDIKYKNLIDKELHFCWENNNRIKNKARQIRSLINTTYGKGQCCDFVLLEKKCKEYAEVEESSHAGNNFTE